MKGGTPEAPAKAPAPLVPGEADEILDLAEQEWELGKYRRIRLEGEPLTRGLIEEEKRICAKLMLELNKRLERKGIVVHMWEPDGLGLGYRLTAYSKFSGLVFRVEFKFDETDRFDTDRSGESFGREVLGLLEHKILTARQEHIDKIRKRSG